MLTLEVTAGDHDIPLAAGILVFRVTGVDRNGVPTYDSPQAFVGEYPEARTALWRAVKYTTYPVYFVGQVQQPGVYYAVFRSGTKEDGKQLRLDAYFSVE